MKKISLMLLACVFALTVNAQEEPLTGKKGQAILPEAGDIGLGINLIPMLNWFGNSFNNTTYNTYASSNKFFTTFGNSVVMGKYMLDTKSAIRVNFGFNFSHYENNKYIFDDASNDPTATVVDTRVSDQGSYTLAVGYEMRRGKRRIQGYYGADVMINVNKSSGNKYSYGNGFSATNSTPTSVSNWGNTTNNTSNSNSRVIQDGVSAQLGIGLRPFIGVEYFVAPKVSIGCEFGYAFMYQHTFKSKNISEYYEVSTSSTVNVETIEGAKNQFRGNVDNFSGAVFLMLYF